MIRLWKSKKQREAERLAEVGAVIGDLIVEVALWRGELKLRADLLLAGFDERLVTLDPSEGLSITEQHEIELMAMLKNGWKDGTADRLAEVRERLNDAWPYIAALGLREHVEGLVVETYEEVGGELAALALAASDEEIARRGVPAGRSLFEG